MSRPSPAQPGADSDALGWLVRRQGGGWCASDESAFTAWLQADAGHPAAYARMQAEWDALDALPANGIAMLRANLADDLQRVQDEESARTAPLRPPPPRPVWPARRGLVVAALSAAGVAVVGGSAAWSAWTQWQARPLWAQGFATERGQQLDVPLPDGSRVRLDSATRVEVAYHRQRREVRLPEGQAVFSVQGDAARPFVVLAGPLRITVVGTRFAVRHTPGLAGDDGVRVAVESGRVRVERLAAAGGPDAADLPALVLAAGQQVASDAAGLLQAVEPVPAGGMAPWREGRVSFDNTRLDQVLAELERYGPTGLVVRDPEVASLRVTGTFNPARMDNFVRLLPQAAPVLLKGDGELKEVVRAR